MAIGSDRDFGELQVLYIGCSPVENFWKKNRYMFLERILKTGLESAKRLWCHISGSISGSTISEGHTMKMVPIPR